MTRAAGTKRRRANGFAAVLMTVALGGTSAIAHQAPAYDTPVRNIAESDTTVLALNLLSDPRPGKRTVRTHSMGNGSYLCSLAGFGQRSRCLRN